MTSLRLGWVDSIASQNTWVQKLFWAPWNSGAVLRATRGILLQHCDSQRFTRSSRSISRGVSQRFAASHNVWCRSLTQICEYMLTPNPLRIEATSLDEGSLGMLSAN